jgi:hypothetical protein
MGPDADNLPQKYFLSRQSAAANFLTVYQSACHGPFFEFIFSISPPKVAAWFGRDISTVAQIFNLPYRRIEFCNA